jgi:hypothetical protein
MTISTSGGAGIADGSYGICDRCAPPCKKCQLPIRTKTVREFFDRTEASKNTATSVHWGNGICAHRIRLFGLVL